MPKAPPTTHLSRTFTAPGKVVVLGEYAVLDGVPAVVAAVNRGVRCIWWPAKGLIIETPASNDRFVRPALERVGAHGRFRFVPDNPTRTASKVGLGSSAAATTVATLAGLASTGITPTARELFDLALATHRAVQGSGSGIDVAASCYGGVIRFEGGQVTPLPPVDLVVIWTGSSAATGPRVQQYLRSPNRAAFVQASAQAVRLFATDPIAALGQARLALQSMAERAGLDYTTPALARIAELADIHGGAAKPSGAGGGDCAVACLPSPQAQAAFVQGCEAEGYPLVPVRIARGAWG